MNKTKDGRYEININPAKEESLMSALVAFGGLLLFMGTLVIIAILLQ